MKKVNVNIILKDHMATLRNDKTGKFSLPDLLLFYVAPALLGIAYFLFPFDLPPTIEGSLIAVFSVFGALLFSAQIALYGLSPKAPEKKGDAVTDELNGKRYLDEKRFFQEVNFNVSYLILVSCVSLMVFLGLSVTNLSAAVEGGVLVFLVTHFFLTLLMLVKRTHVAFAIRHSQ